MTTDPSIEKGDANDCDPAQLKNILLEREKVIEDIKKELSLERKENFNMANTIDDRTSRLKSISEIINLELSEEERILRTYEMLENRYNNLNKKYNFMANSFLGRMTILSWDVYNKIKYGKRPIKKI
jgi:hypothetical protein